MKFALLLVAAVALVVAEEPETTLNLLSLEKKEEEVAAPPALSEELAKEHINSFFELEENPAPADPNATEIHFDTPPAIAQKDATQAVETLADTDMAELEAEVNGPEGKTPGVMIDLVQVFSGSPTIYSILILLSIGSFSIWFYTLLSLRTGALIPEKTLGELRQKLAGKQYEEALSLCKGSSSIVCKMLASGLTVRSHGSAVLLDTINSEGKRVAAALWQRIAVLNDVAIIAPMIGLLGTVLGMFYAFYDLNRSMESISALFDGLGISVGTTVCGLLVAIVAMIFHSITKYRLVRQLALVENEAQSLANLIETR